MDPEEPYSVAKGYVQSAYSMLANPFRLQLPDDTTFFMAFHMLCGFAVELYLKAYLAHKGFTEGQLKKHEIRHDLSKLHELAKNEGFSDSGTGILVELLGEKHKNFEFRYMRKASMYKTLTLQEIFAAFSSLDVVVDACIGASASRGKSPSGAWNFPADGEWRFPRSP